MAVVSGIAFVAGLAKNGATCKLWGSGSFASAPAKDTALPTGSPLQSTTSGTSHGGDGAYRFTGVSAGLYYVSVEYNGSIFYDTTDIKNPLAAPTVKDYGAVGDGVTNDTTAIQAALNDAAEGLIIFPAGTYLSGNLTITGRTHFIVEGQGATLLWTGTAGAGDQIGIRLAGANTNVEIRNLSFQGDGVAANGHAGPWWKNTDSPGDLRISRCRFLSCVRGIVGTRAGSGTWYDVAIDACDFDGIVGTTASSGHGIYLTNDSSVGGDVRITSCYFRQVDQVSIYLVRGVGYAVRDCRFLNHGLGVGTAPAIQVERCSQVSIEANVFSGASGGGIKLAPTGGVNQKDVVILGNSFTDAATAVPELVVGTATPGADGTIDSLQIVGNSFYRSTFRNCSLIDLKCGLRVGIRGNQLTHLGVTSSAEMLTLEGAGEAASRTYTDDVEVVGNTFYATTSGGGAVPAIALQSALCTSTARLGFRGNRMSTTSTFAVGANVTDVNVEVVGQAADGLTFDSTIQSALVSTGRMSVVGTRATQTSFSSAAGRHGFAQASPTSIVHTGGAMATPAPSTAKTGTYTLTETDGAILVDAAGAGFTVTLPDASTCPGRVYAIRKITAGNTVTLAPAAGQIDGGANLGITGAKGYIVQSFGVNWWSIAQL